MKIKTTSSDCIYYPNTPLKEPAFNCSFVHKVEYCRSTSIEVLQYSLLDYSSTCIGILQYSLLDYSSTCIGLLQYFYRITPVLLSESIKVLPHASPPNPFPHQLVNPFPRLLRIIYIIGSRRVSKLTRRLAILV